MTMNQRIRPPMTRAIHAYGRARAALDYDHPLAAEVERMVRRVRTRLDRVFSLIADELRYLTVTTDGLEAIAEFAAELAAYGDARHRGAGPDAATSVLAALDHLLDVGHRAEAAERTRQAVPA